MTKLPVHDFYITSRPKRDWLTQHIRARELDEAMQYAKDGLPEGREFGRPEEVLSVDPNGSNVTPIRSLSNERDQFPCPNQ